MYSEYNGCVIISVFQCQDNLPLSPPPLNSRAASIDHLLAAVNLAQSREDLRWRGSQADVATGQTPQVDNKRKKRVSLDPLPPPLSLSLSHTLIWVHLRTATEEKGHLKLLGGSE